jgi:hypothetical protein
MKWNLSLKNVMLVSCLIAFGCQKLDRPVMGDYPPDANPPGGPLKFYAAMDEKNVDSIKANYGTFNDASITDGGVSGKAAQFDGSKNGFINYPSANDFGSASDFTVSFWMSIALDQKNHQNATGVLAFSNTKNFWGNITVFLEHETSTSDSMPLKMHFNAANNGDNWQAAGYTDNKRLPKMYDGQWHNVVITYHAADSVYTLYRDGAQFDQMTMNPAIKFENASQLILGGFQQAAGVNGNYSENTWMSGYPGKLDNIRLYGETLSAADVEAIYANKE